MLGCSYRVEPDPTPSSAASASRSLPSVGARRGGRSSPCRSRSNVAPVAGVDRFTPGGHQFLRSSFGTAAIHPDWVRGRILVVRGPASDRSPPQQSSTVLTASFPGSTPHASQTRADIKPHVLPQRPWCLGCRGWRLSRAVKQTKQIVGNEIESSRHRHGDPHTRSGRG